MVKNKQWVVIGADHAGLSMKDHLVKQLEKKYNIVDMGPHAQNKNDDYTDFAHKVSKQIQRTNNLGVLVCGTGIGMSIAANKHKGIYAAHVTDEKQAKLAREHNHANVVTISGKQLSKKKGTSIVESFLKATPDNALRHVRRIKKVKKIEAA